MNEPSQPDNAPEQRSRGLSFELRVTLAYVAIAASWIYFSDRALTLFTTAPEQMRLLSTYKGWLYVAVTAALLFSVLRRFVARVRETQHRLTDSEQRFRNVFQASPMGIYLYQLEPDGRLVLIDSNPAADRIIGIELPRLRGRTIEEAFPNLADTEVPERFRRAAGDGTPWSVSDFSYHDGQTAGDFDFHVFQTSPGRIAVMFRDVANRKRAEQERLRLEANLRHAQKMEAIGTLATGIAHDFNNLLTAISGYTDLAKSHVPADHPAHQALDIVDIAIRDAGGIANALLTFSRRTVAGKAPVDLCKVVTDSLKLLRRILPADIDVQDSLPPGHPVFVFADVGQLHQVLMNLITNARDAMPDGGTIRIQLTREDASSHAPEGLPGDREAALLVVEDSGIGMTPNVVARIFDPFFTTKPRGKGTGLGMAIVHGIIEEHQGRVHVASELGKGTRISIRLPCCDPPPSAAAESTTAQAATAGPRLPLLLAEDEAFVRTLISQSFGAAGYTVVETSNGLDALSAFAANPGGFHLAVLDIELPKIGGRQCLEEIRKTTPHLPVILITGNPEFAMDEDSDDHLVLLRKPFKMANLVKLAESMVAALDGPQDL